MSVLINADTSDGLKFTSDTSGEIKLQSAGTDIATVSSTGITMASGKLLAPTGPTFSAYKNTNQSLSSGAYTKITFEAEDFDTDSCYDTSTSRFTPNVAGYYYVQAETAYTAGTSLEVAMGIYKNGATAKRIFDMITPDGRQSGGSALIYMNGTTDYLEVFQYSSINLTIVAGAIWTFFQANLVRAA